MLFREPPRSLGVHSIGGQLVGLARSSRDLSRIVHVAVSAPLAGNSLVGSLPSTSFAEDDLITASINMSVNF